MEQKLVWPSKQLKQLIQTEHNIVKNPKWPEANQLAICKHGRRFELGAAEKQIQAVVRAGLEPGTTELRFRHADHSATLSPPIAGSRTNYGIFNIRYQGTKIWNTISDNIKLLSQNKQFNKKLKSNIIASY